MKIKVWATLSSCEDSDSFEISDEELEGLSEEDAEKVIQDAAEQVMWNMVDWGWSKEDK